MATNNIKIFDQNKENMLTDEAYNTSTQRLNGVQQGIASSQLQNKTLYQVSLVAYAIGQMMQANGLNANDADAVSTFAGNLSNTIVQKILDKADTTEAKNFTVNNKFITPQTWKAAYDFMKADSDMVASAVDDTHYITPKLLKEGANLFGGKVELEDGTITSWRTFNKKVVNKCNAFDFAPFSASDIKYILVDKLKRYYIYMYLVVYSYSLVLYDYNTNEKLDILTSGKIYEGNTLYFNQYLHFSALSENMFLVACRANNYVNFIAVDFSTGKFVIKNIYNTNSSYYIDEVYADRTKYFTTDLYTIYYFDSNNGYSIIRYNIATNTFYNYTKSGSWQSPAIAIDDDGKAIIIFSSYSSALTQKLYCVISSSDFSTIYDLGGDIYRNQSAFSFEYKNGYIYLISKITSAGYRVGKFSVRDLNYQVVFYGDTNNTFPFCPLVVNDEETAAFVQGNKYGTGDMEVERIEVPYLIGDSRYNYKTVLGYDTAQNLIIIKYKNKFCFYNFYFIFDLVYAYFGAPVTEIPEST